SAPLSPTDRARLAKEFEVTVEEPPPPGSRGLVIKSLRWVIKAEDLGFFKSLLDAVKAAATAGFLLAAGASETTSAIIGVAVAALLILRQAVRKGGRPSEDAVRILAVLSGKPMTEDELLTVLRHTQGAWWTAERVHEAIQSLSKFRVANGEVIALVQQDATD